MIEVRNLSKSYGDKMVVHDVSLKIQKGKITSLIGPNGAGKSTAFSMITRLMKRDGGQVFIEGDDISQPGDIVKVRILQGFDYDVVGERVDA